MGKVGDMVAKGKGEGKTFEESSTKETGVDLQESTCPSPPNVINGSCRQVTWKSILGLCREGREGITTGLHPLFFFPLLQAMPVNESEDEAQAAMKLCLPSEPPSAPPQTPMDTTEHLPRPPAPGLPLAQPAPAHHSINSPIPASQLTTYSALRGGDSSTVPESAPAPSCDPSLLDATVTQDPVLVAFTQALPLASGYTPSSGYVSYMETLLDTHFPSQDLPLASPDEGQGPVY